MTTRNILVVGGGGLSRAETTEGSDRRTTDASINESDAPTRFDAPTIRSPQFGFGESNLRRAFWLIVAMTGLLEAWDHRFQVDFDGVSYLDIAQNYLRGDWHASINAYWSPLYSWLLVLPLSVLHNSLYWESTLLHLVNFVSLLAAYAAFEFLLGEVICNPVLQRKKEETAAILPERAWRILGLALFLSFSLNMLNYNGATPDVLVAVSVYTAAGLLLRIQAARATAGTYICLGLTLGLGYLAKAAMFPLGVIFLGVAMIAAPKAARARPWFALAVFVFALVAGPWIGVLSHSKHRFTFGDSGKLAYVAAANSVQKLGFRVVSAARGPKVLHPLSTLSTNPEVLGFASPVSGTFPPWYDGSYWAEGEEAHFHWRNQLEILHGSYDSYFDILISQEALVVGVLVFLLVDGGFLSYLVDLLRAWALWLPALAAIGMYSLVLVQTRYVAPFLSLIGVILYAALRLPNGMATRRWTMAVPWAILVVISLPIARGLTSDIYQTFHPQPYEAWEVAEGLHQLGVQPNDAISIIGLPADTFDWARLAGVRIVSAIPPAAVDEYWSASPDEQAHVSSLLRGTGAKAAVIFSPPPERSLAMWTEVGSSPYYVTLLDDTHSSSSNRSVE